VQIEEDKVNGRNEIERNGNSNHEHSFDVIISDIDGKRIVFLELK